MKLLVLLHRLEVKRRHAGIRVFGEAVGEIVANVLHGTGVGVDVEVAESVTIRAQVVQSAHVVIMLMGQQHAVYLLERDRKQLHAYVRTAIDKHTCATCRLYKSYAAQTTVTQISTATHLTLAAKRRYATRRASTKQCNRNCIFV